MNHKKKFSTSEYYALVALMASNDYDESEKKVSNLGIENKDDLIRGLDYARLYLISDLAAVWLRCERSSFERMLFSRFYKTYPDDFLRDFRSAIKSRKTIMSDICVFFMDNFAPDDADLRYEISLFVSTDLAASLANFSALFRSTKKEDGCYIVNKKKADRIKKRIVGKRSKFPFLVALISFAAGMAVMFGISAVFEFYFSPQQVQNTPSQSASQSSGKYDLVYYTPNGKKFHRENCSTIAGSSNVKHCMRNSIDKKLEPCSVCRP